MTIARHVLTGLLLFGLLCFAGAGSTLAGKPVHLSCQHERRAQMSDLYTPSHASHLLLLRYPLWFQFEPATNYSEVFAQRTISRPPLTTL
jgi:hypothetical protein